MESVETHQHAKFRQNRPFHCGDIAIFRIFKMAAAAILDFWYRKILLIIRMQRARRIYVPNFVKIGQSVAKILRCFDFSRWRSSAILDSFVAYLDDPQWVLVGHYHSAKFGCDRCGSFYNMNISVFDTFGVWLKNAYSRPRNWVFWAIWSPKWDAVSTKAKRGTPLQESASFEPLSVKMWWTVWPVGELLKKGV